MSEVQPECAESATMLAEMNRRARRERLPVTGSLALTHRCNLRCRHCYAACGADAEDSELPLARWLALLDELADAGCLFMVMTGGEPLFHRDFARIYTAAREKGIMVSVFTNGTLVDDRILALFRELPPRIVDVTLYGASEDGYRAVTGSGAAWGRVRRGIDAMLGQGTRVGVKTVLLSLNRPEFPAIEALAAQWGVRFRMDPMVFPRYSGDREPLAWRIPAEEAVALEFSDPERVQRWRAFYERQRGVGWGDRLYACGAGVTCFHIDPAGLLQPCVMARHLGVRLTAGGFMEGWKRVVASIASRALPAGSPCGGCEARAVCGYCPAFSALETGDESVPSPYLCALGRSRLRSLTKQGGDV